MYTPAAFPFKTTLRTILAPISILFLGFLLRIYRLDAQAFTGDEAFSIVNWTQASISYLLNTLAVIDPQPPVALLSLSGWVYLVGESEFASRSLSLFAGIITLAAAYRITHNLASRRAALIAISLCTINPFLLWHSQDLRPYSLWIATSALTLWAFTAATITSHTSVKTWLSYTLLAAITIFTFYFEAFLLFAQNIIVVIRGFKRCRLLLPWGLAQASIVLLLAPWFLRPEIRNNTYQPTATMPNIPQAIQTLLFGNTIPATVIPSQFLNVLSILLVLSSLLVLWFTRPKKTAMLITVYTLTPILLLTALTLITQRGYFRPRYIATTSFSLTLAGALLLDSLIAYKRFLRYVIAAAISSSIVTISGISLFHYYYNPFFAKAPNWYELVNTLHSQTAVNDTVIFNYPDPAFVHYFKGPATSLFLPVTANPSQNQADQDIATLLSTHEYLWFIPVYVETWDGQQVIAKALNNQSQLISDQWIGQTHLLQYAAWQPSLNQIATHLQIPLGTLATIEGYRTTPHQSLWLPGTTIYIELFWRPLRQLDTDLTVFSHLLGPNQPDGSPLWSQDDYPPQDGRTSTSSWTPGVLIRDTYTLTLPNIKTPTTYTITIGLYDPATGERHRLDSITPQSEPDGATLITFTINPTK